MKLNEINIVENVSIAFNIFNKDVRFDKYSCMLDSGSPASFVRMNLLPFEVSNDELVTSSYRGISGYPIRIFIW